MRNGPATCFPSPWLSRGANRPSFWRGWGDHQGATATFWEQVTLSHRQQFQSRQNFLARWTLDQDELRALAALGTLDAL